METVNIQVDGKTLEARPGEMLIQVTDRNNIYIPRFCYHDKLSVVANCRMCLVEVEKASKLMPACATSVMDGMKVQTRSRLAIEAQKGTMEFLLINHPLDCPVCDQGGECPLQDQAIGYGRDDSRFMEKKRVVPSHNIGPLIATEMTRCIHCTRCVRFGEEVAGVMEMGAPGRGENVRISTFLNQSIDSEVSGNIIDLCPVGALTSRPFRFSARSWELKNHQGISPHDCLGTNLTVQTLRGEVERVLPRENPDINECWLADRDRFSYQATHSNDRLTQPMIKKAGQWLEVDWQTALEHAATGFKAISQSALVSDLAGLAAPGCTLEEFYLLQKLMRSLGSENIDHRVQWGDFTDRQSAFIPGSEVALSYYAQLQGVLLVGSNIRKEQPLLSLKLRQGCLKNQTRVAVINPIDFDFNFDPATKIIAKPSSMVLHLAGMARLLEQKTGTGLPDDIEQLPAKAVDEDVLQVLSLGRNDKGTSLILLGALAQQHQDAAFIRRISTWMADITGARLAVLPPANSVAAYLAQCLPGNQGHNAQSMFAEGCKGYLLMGVEPELDCNHPQQAYTALNKAEFVIQINAFKSASSLQYANVLLPMAVFTETAGSYVNCEGKMQFAHAAASPRGDAKPAWKILRVLANFLQCDGFDYVSLEDVQQEIGQDRITVNVRPPAMDTAWKLKHVVTDRALTTTLERIADFPMYRGESILRHAQALQDTTDNAVLAAHVNVEQAEVLNVQQGEEIIVSCPLGKTRLPVNISNRIPAGCVYIPLGFSATRVLDNTVQVRLEKI